MKRVKTLGELKKLGYKSRSVKEEIRDNLICKLQDKKEIFSGIVGYEHSVIPQIENALLSCHDIILLGLRGQAKTRLVRNLSLLLDEFVPVIAGSPIPEDPLLPVSKYAKQILSKKGDSTPIQWISREERYQEKLATPDVTMADIIGDVDPIKAANLKLDYSDEEVIHYGLIPRSNRGIFAINEIPDLQARIQVGLLNILEEKDIQIRGFPIRMPLDILLVFTANPEDYTHRGNIITPLKDRINSQILTHYPKNLGDAIKITSQEAWIHRNSSDSKKSIEIPYLFQELIEEIVFEARESEFVDQSSGVSARMSISIMENLISNAERRQIRNKKEDLHFRICDLFHTTPSITGKLELVYEGEKEGPATVARYLIGKAIKKIFSRYFPDPFKVQFKEDPRSTYYRKITEWFNQGKKLTLSDQMPFDEYSKILNQVPSLKKEVEKHFSNLDQWNLASLMELVLEGLHQNSMLSKKDMDSLVSYREMLNLIYEKSKRRKNVEDDFII